MLDDHQAKEISFADDADKFSTCHHGKPTDFMLHHQASRLAHIFVRTDCDWIGCHHPGDLRVFNQPILFDEG